MFSPSFPTQNTERLAADANTRRDMIAKASAEEIMETQEPGSVAGAWKWAIRKKIWDMMEEKNYARPPRPVHHRIPNFDGADKAANRLADQVHVHICTPYCPLDISRAPTHMF